MDRSHSQSHHSRKHSHVCSNQPCMSFSWNHRRQTKITYKIWLSHKSLLNYWKQILNCYWGVFFLFVCFSKCPFASVSLQQQIAVFWSIVSQLVNKQAAHLILMLKKTTNQPTKQTKKHPSSQKTACLVSDSEWLWFWVMAFEITLDTRRYDPQREQQNIWLVEHFPRTNPLKATK